MFTWNDNFIQPFCGDDLKFKHGMFRLLWATATYGNLFQGWRLSSDRTLGALEVNENNGENKRKGSEEVLVGGCCCRFVVVVVVVAGGGGGGGGLLVSHRTDRQQCKQDFCTERMFFLQSHRINVAEFSWNRATIWAAIKTLVTFHDTDWLLN